MAMQILNENLQVEAQKLSIREDELQELIRWAQIQCGSKRLLHAMGLGDFHTEYDEWHGYSEVVDVNFYINENDILKAFAYPVVNGEVQTDGETEVILISVPFFDE
jgi:hypothetical protein